LESCRIGVTVRTRAVAKVIFAHVNAASAAIVDPIGDGERSPGDVSEPMHASQRRSRSDEIAAVPRVAWVLPQRWGRPGPQAPIGRDDAGMISEEMS
jgi:hypothetical protein